jgi:hypothetical protein
MTPVPHIPDEPSEDPQRRSPKDIIQDITTIRLPNPTGGVPA